MPLSARLQDVPVFRSGVDLVRLDIRVVDGQGRPIPDLRADEVQITDGDRRPVLLFQHIAESGRSHFEAVQRTVAAEVSTNLGSPRGQLYVLLFDQQHLTPGREQRARQAAAAFLRQHVHSQDRVALYGLPGPGPSQPFTASLTTCLAQLEHVRGGLQRMVTGIVGDMTVHEAYEILRGNAEVLGRFMTPSPRLGNGDAARTSALADQTRGAESRDMLERVIRENAQVVVSRADEDSRQFLRLTAEALRSLRAVDGRKTVILFTEGFHSDHVSREIQEVAAAAAETYSVVYAFDLNTRVENYGAEPIGNDAARELSSRLESIGTIAADTNGALIMDALSHLDQALNDLGDVNNDYYIVGFAPQPEALANRESYRHVQVKVTRPGAAVHVRTGYATGPAPSPADRRRAIDAALAAPFSQQGLQLEYTTYVSGSEAGGAPRVVVSLEAELPVARPDREQAADIVFVVRDSRTGAVAASGSDQIGLPAGAAPGVTTGRGTWRVQFRLPAGVYRMRCVVREPGGLVGSADRQFTVRALNGPDVAASDLVLGTPGLMLPVRAQGYQGSPFSGAIRVYARSLEQIGRLDGRLDLVPLGSETSSISVTGTVAEARDDGPPVSRDVMFDVPLTGVPEGEYVARAIVRAGGEVVADLRRQVVVNAGTAPASAAPAASSRASAPPRPKDVLSGLVVQRVVADAARSSDPTVRRAAGAVLGQRWTEALGTLEPIPASNPDAERLRGLALIGQERYGEAATRLGVLFDAHPTDPALAFVLGWGRIGAGDRTGAVTAFRNAAVLEPTLLPAHLALAHAYLDLGQTALAVQAVEAGLAALPDASELKRLLETIRR